MNALRMFETARRKIEPTAAIIATGPAFYVFVAGLLLSRYWRVPLVLDYRDEWTECPFGFVSTGNMDRYWEGKCLTGAARVIFTTDAQREFRLRLFSGLNPEKCHVIPNGWEPADWCKDEPVKRVLEESQTDQKIRVVYVGTLSDHASPRPFLTAIRSLVQLNPELGRRLEIKFVGRCSGSSRQDIDASGLGDMVKLVGELPRPEANKAMLQADVLLLIALPELQRYIPGKLYEYVASGRPILVYGHEGEASRLVRELDAGAFVAEGDVTGIRRAILTLSQKASGLESTVSRQRWLEQHSRASLAGKLFQLVEAMLPERSSFPGNERA